MFKSKKQKNGFQARASWGSTPGDDLIVDLKKNKNSEKVSSSSEQGGWNWKVLLRLPVGGLKIFTSRKDKGVEFMKNFPQEKKEGLISKVFRIVRSGCGLLRVGFSLFFKLFLYIPGLFLKTIKALLFLRKINPLRAASRFKLTPKKGKEKERSSRKKKDEDLPDDGEERAFLSRLYSSNKFFLKSLFSFFFLLVLFILPFKVLDYYTSFDLAELKGSVLSSSEKAFFNFKTAARALTEMDTREADRNFSQADVNFSQAQEKVEEINGLLLELSRFVPQEEIRLASVSKQVLAAGRAASELGQHFTSAFDTLLKFQKGESDQDNALEIIEEFQSQLKRSLKDTRKIKKNISQIDPEILPREYKDKFLDLRSKIRGLEKGLEEVVVLAEKSKIFLGLKDYDKKYLVVFQNSNELRATGGFIGSFAEISFRNGRLEDVKVPGGGSYDVDGGMTELIASPRPLQLVSAQWNFRDANWWPDWPTSARNLIRFYEKSGGPTVDGCIAITPEVLGRILEVTGPLDMTDKYGIIINKDNFWASIRAQIEKEKESDKPKQIIQDLTHKIIRRLSRDLNKEKLLGLISGVQKSLAAKDVQFYFSDSELQQEVINKGWGGRIKDTDRDYLMVVNSNIAGQKSDKKISQAIDHKVDIKKDGSVVDTLRITRIHHGNESDKQYYRARNVDWMRVYVPQGSRLLQARGFERPGEKFFEEPDKDWDKNPLIKEQQEKTEYHRPSGTRIYPEQGKTVFANWSILPPGKTEIIELKYRLPFKLKSEDRAPRNWKQKLQRFFQRSEEEYLSYSLLLQRQAGSDVSQINSVVVWPQESSLAWHYPEEASINENSWFLSRKLNSDQYWAAVLKTE